MSSQNDRKVIADVRDYLTDSTSATRRKYLAALAATAATGVAGCVGGGDGDSDGGDGDGGDGGDGSTPTSSESGDGGSGESGDSDKLIVADLAGLENLDPPLVSAVVNFHVLENTNERLFNLTPELEVETELATDLEVSNGGKTWTMPIREGVMFHEPYKRELVAEDFKKVFEWIINSDSSPYGYYFANVNEILAPDDHTLQLELASPVADLKIILAKQGTSVWPMEAREEMDDLKQHPVGTGPYVFDEWVPDSHTRLTKNPDYWADGVPHFEEIEIRPIPKSEVRLTELETGEVEFMEPSPNHVQAIKDNDDLVFDSVMTGAFNEVKINCSTQWRDGNPFADSNGGIKARQAVIEAIDYPSIVQGAGLGVTTPTQEPFPETSPWHIDYNPYTMEANPEKAEQLLNEAGLGTDITVRMRTNTAYDSHQSAAKIIQENLRQVGITAELEFADWATQLQYEGNGEFDLAVNGWPMFVSPDAFLYSIFHSEGGFNSQDYANDQLDSLLEQARVELDREKRIELYADAQKIIVDEVAGYIFLQHWPVMKGYHSNIRGYVNHPYNYLGWNFTDVREA